MIRWLFKWVWRLAALAVVLAVTLALSLNSILRAIIEHKIRAQTGMDAEIGRVELGWTEPTFEIRDLKIYNPPSFGGTPFLDIPEIHIEYSRAAILKREIHLTLLRFNLAELDVVRSKSGQINIYSIGKVTGQIGAAPAPLSFKQQTGYDFKGIDALNVSFERAKFIDLANPRNNREQTIGIQNWVIPDVKSANDLAGLAAFVELRSNHFFDPFIGKPRNSASLQSFLSLMGATL
jgi:uncharacterized protein involved in outer membrane biogenesis